MEDLDDIDGLMAELDRDLKRPGSADGKKASRPKVTYSGPAVAITWKPAHVALHVLSQTCTCGCEAQSVTGLFLEYTNPNGYVRSVRTTKDEIPPDFAGSSWRIEETLEHIAVCPGCIEIHNPQKP